MGIWWLDKMSRKQSHYIQLDLIVMLLILVTVSVLAIYNAQQLGQYPDKNFALQQTVYYGMGLGVLIVMQFFDLEQYRKVSLYVYILGVLSVFLLSIPSSSMTYPVNNANSWFNGSMFPLTIQPSEFAKIGLIMYLSAIIVKHKEKNEVATLKSDLWLIAKLIIITLIPFIFIIEQPDLGTSVVFFFITGMLIILSGIDWKILITLIVGGIAALVLAVFLIVNLPDIATNVLGIKPYQIERVMTWFEPGEQLDDDRFQIDRSLLTIGSGQLSGKGMNSAEVALPEAHTDFIFSIIGESFGFIGSAAVVFVFFLLIYRFVTLGMQSYDEDPYGSFLCFGFMALVLIHTFQNIGMTIGIMPITGIPLLFVSYGGSTTLSTMIGFALIYKVATEHSRQQSFLF